MYLNLDTDCAGGTTFLQIKMQKKPFLSMHSYYMYIINKHGLKKTYSTECRSYNQTMIMQVITNCTLFTMLMQ